MPELYMHRIGRTGRADREQQLVYCNRGRKKQVEIEVLMNMELVIESFLTEVEVSAVNRTGKERQVVKFLMKRRILMETVPQKKKVKE
jgi:ATP-dependent RNA helicase RhlE